MEHLLLKAATTATDEGVFEAVISTPTVDRDKDIVEPAAMVAALKKWADLGKLVPLAWAHTDEIVGSVDASTVRVENGEVITKGRIDQSTPRGEEAWRLVKSGTLSFSFGYLIPNGGATKIPGGRFRIKELDVFEISVVPVGPANNDTRVLSFKNAEALREEAKKVEREVEQTRVPDVPESKAPPVDHVAELAKAKGELAETKRQLEEATKEPVKDPKALRQEATKAAREITRELEEQQLPKVLPAPEVDYAAEMSELKAQIAKIATVIEEAAKPKPPDAKTQREKAKRAARELEEQQIPDVPEQPKAPAEPEINLAKEFQEVKAQLAEMAKGLEDLKSRTDETDKDPARDRSVDPQRKQAEALALEVASGGRSLHKPPPTIAPKRPEPALSLKELRQRTRDEMLGVLSGGTIE